MSAHKWHATVIYASGETPPSDDQVQILNDRLPGYTVIVHDGRHLQLQLTVEASTLKRADDEAQKVAQAAYAAAFDAVGVKVGLRILTQEEHERELSRPDPYDLVGIAEIVEMGGFNSRQAAKNATQHKDFPAPVAELRMGPVYTRPSVNAFLQRWPRLKGWAGKRAAEQAKDA